MKNTSAARRILNAVSIWLILTFLFSLFNNSFEKYAILIQAINAALFTSGFYFSYYFLIRKFLYKGKTSAFVLLYFLTIACLSMLSMVLVYRVYILENNKLFVDTYWTEPVFYTSNYILILLVTSSLLSFRFLKDKIQTQTLLDRAEKEKISTELSFLKAQVNPHFLFNSLNNILFQIDKSNSQARDTLLKFSEMLRYQLYECSSDRIDIEKELQYIQNYIGIQMLRKTEKYKCDLVISNAVKNFHIAPLLLIPFIENAFKHVSNHSSGNNSIRISMDYSDEKFIFSVTNDKDNIISTTINENKGIGFVNVKRRLDLMYSNKYTLEIVNAEKQFSVDLKMEIA
jgi:two-component system LytT family sensor kinase